jgi:hypothetical protein
MNSAMCRWNGAACAACVLLTLGGISANAEQLIFQSADGVSSEILVQPREGGYSVTSKALGAQSEATTDAAFATLQWVYHYPAGSADVTCKRSGNSILVDGIIKGRKIEKTHAIDGNPWYQDWGLGLRAFIRGRDTRWQFWSVNPGDPGAIAKFEATKEGEESLTFNGAPVETMRVKVSLPGFLSIFFQADFWFRASDGVLVRWKFPRGSGKPALVTDLVTDDERCVHPTGGSEKGVP